MYAISLIFSTLDVVVVVFLAVAFELWLIQSLVSGLLCISSVGLSFRVSAACFYTFF